MKRLVACLLALLLPFTTCCASSVNDIFSAMQTAQETTVQNVASDPDAVTAEGYKLELNIQSPTMAPVVANGFVGVGGEELLIQADTPWLKPFTLFINPQGEMKLLTDSQWYDIVTEEMPAAAQAMTDPNALMQALEKDLEVLLPILAPAFSKLATSPAVVLTGLKISSLVDTGVFSISGTDLNMVLNEVYLALNNIDMAALASLNSQLTLGAEFYGQLLDELADLVEELAEMEFQFKGNLKDEEKGFVSLIAEDFEFTVNYHEDEALDQFLLDGVLRIDHMPLTFDVTIGNDVTVNYQAGNAHGTITAIMSSSGQTLSLSGSHYVVKDLTGYETLEALWSADLASQPNGFILAVDADEKSRFFVDFKFENDPATGSLSFASLNYKDVEQEHQLMLTSTGEASWLASYALYMRGQLQGTITLTATPGTVQVPVMTDASAVGLEEALSLVQLAPPAANP